MSTIDARQIQKISTVGGQIPTVAPSNNHKDGTWTVTDCYSGEILVNEADGKVYALVGTVVVELGSAGTVDLATVLSNGNTTSGNDIEISYDNSIVGESGNTLISMGSTLATNTMTISSTSGSNNSTTTTTPTYSRVKTQDAVGSSSMQISVNTITVSVDSGTVDAQTTFTDEGFTSSNSVTGDVFRVNSVGAVLPNNITPTSTADTVGETGQIAFDSSFIYVKTSAGWKRTSITTF